uniref:Uncharacterized protein n=1 Tax=Rhizophora mucronata TaxID=61149 RepID=A0A2P2Q0U6_RHIMU
MIGHSYKISWVNYLTVM